MRQLTARQAEVLALIRESIAAKGYPPTLREIGARMGIRSTNGVNDHLRALERKGMIGRDDMSARGIRLVDPRPLTESVPPAPRVVSNDRIQELRRTLDGLQTQIKLVQRAIELEEQIERGRRRIGLPSPAAPAGEPWDDLADTVRPVGHGAAQ